jgi:hypothetical protein
MRAILVIKDMRHIGEVNPNLMEFATAEVLRACVFAAERVLIPATAQLLPFAAVIAHDMRQIAPEGPERFSPRPGRFVPIAREPKLTEGLSPFLRSDLGAESRNVQRGLDIVPLSAAVKEYPPNVVVALTTDETFIKPLQSLVDKPRVLYFQSLIGSQRGNLEKQFGPLASSLIDLEHDMKPFDDRDKESGRSDDEYLEPFVPFGVLLQDALWAT